MSNIDQNLNINNEINVNSKRKNLISYSSISLFNSKEKNNKYINKNKP